jgi:hypothetical protein
MKNNTSAASKLLGMSLPNGWAVVEELKPGPNQTGGTFSHGYKVQATDRKGFLKAFDFSDAFRTDSPGDIIQKLQSLIDCFRHESDILNHCKSRRLSKVVIPLDQGTIDVPGTK